MCFSSLILFKQKHFLIHVNNKSLNWLFNLKNLFWGLKPFLCLSLRGPRWFPHYGWRGHSAVSCCFQVSSEYWFYILKMCMRTCFGKTWFLLLLLAGLLEAKSLLNIMKQEGTNRLQIWNCCVNEMVFFSGLLLLLVMWQRWCPSVMWTLGQREQTASWATPGPSVTPTPGGTEGTQTSRLITATTAASDTLRGWDATWHLWSSVVLLSRLQMWYFTIVSLLRFLTLKVVKPLKSSDSSH